MRILDNKRVYLSSPIEFSADESWRHSVKKTLISEFNLRVFDPFDDPKQHLTSDIQKFRAEKNYVELAKISKYFVRTDLAILDHADICISFVPNGVSTTGVVHEIVNSNNSKKLTLLVEGTDKSKIAFWYFGFVKEKFMFGKWTDLYDFLDDINKGMYKDEDRLFFLHNYPTSWLG